MSAEADNTISATVILPTTGDRKEVLEHSIPQVLNQSVRDIECFVIGDGVNDETARYLTDLAAAESRLKFFPHPKHPRRGEEYRHALLQQAKGRIVCYLCDRDLLFKHHVEHHLELLENHDLAVSQGYAISQSGNVKFMKRRFCGTLPNSRLNTFTPYFQLTATAHTMDAYRRLPFGWRTTPRQFPTDVYMWKQFMSQPDCRVNSSEISTFMYFKRGDHPGMSSAERAAELSRWTEAVHSKDLQNQLQSKALRFQIEEPLRQQDKAHRTPLLIFGRTPSVLLRRQLQKLAKKRARQAHDN